MTRHKLFTPRRIGVCGSGKGLPAQAIPFCEILGKELADKRSVVIVSGGTRKREGAGIDDYAAEWHIINSALKFIPNEEIMERIETIESSTLTETEQFRIGFIRQTRGKT